MALPRLPLAWNWTGVKTDTDDRSLQQGELTSLVNFRRTVEGRLQKRLGLDRTPLEQTDGDELPGPATDVVPSDTLIVRDADDVIYAVDADNVAHDRGTDHRAHATSFQVTNLQSIGAIHKPLVVESDGRVYHMVLGFNEISGISGIYIQVTVYDTEGVLLASPSFILTDTFTPPIATAYSACADASGNVWVAWVKQDTGIRTAKLSIIGAVVLSTTITVAATEFQDVKIRLMPNGQILLAALSVDTVGANATVKRYHAYLDTTTGGAAASPAPVTATVTAGPANPNITCGPGLSIANSEDDTSLYFLHLWAADTSTSLLLKRVQINPTTFAESETTVRTVTVSAATDEVWIGATCAFHLAGVVTVFSSLNQVDATDGPIATRTSTVVKSVSGVDTTIARSAYVAGDDVFKIGSVRHILTGFDDMVDDETPGVQRGYFVRDVTGRIVTSILDGVGAQIFFMGGYFTEWQDPSIGHTVTPAVVGTTVHLPLLTMGDAQSIAEPVLATVDFDATWHSMAPNLVLGGIPKTVSKEDELTELTPIHFPYVDPTIQFDGAGVNWARNRFAYRYVTIDARGNRVPSAPRPTVELQFHAGGILGADNYFVRVATLRHATGNVWIELFMSDDQDSGGHPTAGSELYLARRLPNVPTTDFCDFPVNPQAFVAGSGELLDTTNLEARLENGSAPSARLAAVWRNRLFLAGTPEDDIVYSHEKRDGHGYEFNEALAVEWADGTGPVTAIAPLSFDAFVVFREDAIGLITGPGPAPDGSPNFDIQTISYKRGTVNPKAVLLGPLGVYFIATADQRPYLITTAGQIVGIGKGYESFVGIEVTAAIHDEEQGHVVYCLSDGTRMVLDYGHPLPDQPAGQWYQHSNTNLPMIVGAVTIDGVPTFVDGENVVISYWTNGVSFDDDGTAVLKDLITGRMPAVGLLQEFDLDEFTISSTRLGGDSAYRYTLTDDQGVTEVHNDSANTTRDVNFRSAISRTREFRLRIQETSATGEGRSFDGIGVVVRPRGRFENYRRRVA